jgi:hypothetical protein
MEQTCSRCHQTVNPEDCFCPVCGLPQLVYSSENSNGAGQPDRWGEAVRDAGAVQWKAALRAAISLGIPAGLFSSMLSPVGIFGLVFMVGAGAWVVALYMRSQRLTWMTVATGARIGLVTGVLGGWTAAAMTGLSLYAMRFWLHQGTAFDDGWRGSLTRANQIWASAGFDAQTIATLDARFMSPEGRAASVLTTIALLMAALLVMGVAGGALGARFLARPRRPEN